MGSRDLADLELWRDQPQPSLATAVAGDAASFGERDVRLHLASVQQFADAGMAGDAASADDTAGQHSALCCWLVDLALSKACTATCG